LRERDRAIAIAREKVEKENVIKIENKNIKQQINNIRHDTTHTLITHTTSMAPISTATT